MDESHHEHLLDFLLGFPESARLTDVAEKLPVDGSTENTQNFMTDAYNSILLQIA